MGRLPNDGRGRLGGRAKGTKNYGLIPLDEWAEDIVNRRRRQFMDDLDRLTPQERAPILGQIFAALLSSDETRTTTRTIPRTRYQALRLLNRKGTPDD